MLTITNTTVTGEEVGRFHSGRVGFRRLTRPTASYSFTSLRPSP